MKVNLNQNCKVKLTEKGRKLLKRNWEDLMMGCEMEYEPAKVDEDGYTTMQLWEIMKEFGEYMFNGCDPCIETEIIVQPLWNLEVRPLCYGEGREDGMCNAPIAKCLNCPLYPQEF